MKASNIFFGAVGVCFFTSTTLAGNVADSDIVTFSPNATAKAAEVNQNFTKLKAANNDNDAQITTNTTNITTNTNNITANTGAISAKQNRVTGTCGAGSAINTISINGSVTCETTMDIAAGVEFANSDTYFNVTSTATMLFSVALDAPTNGFAIVSFSGICALNHTTGTNLYLRFDINTTLAAGVNFTGGTFRYLQVPAAAPTGEYYYACNTSFTQPVNAGTTTYYLDADSSTATTGTTRLGYGRLDAIFVPARY